MIWQRARITWVTCIARPVEQQVTLREEKVIVERRAPIGTDSKPDVLTETVIEMSDSRQVPTVWKSLHVAEANTDRRTSPSALSDPEQSTSLTSCAR